MHSFLKSIGFSNIPTVKEEEKLLKNVRENYQERTISHNTGDIHKVEMYYEVADGIGIVLHGEMYDENDTQIQHYFPVLRSEVISTRESVTICKRVDTDAYNGMCEDCRIGISVIFYLQNGMDYYNIVSRDKKDDVQRMSLPIYLSALAESGTILLPIAKQQDKLSTNTPERVNNKMSLIAEARKGNQEAIESLTIEDIDKYAMVSKRIKTEDLFSIVETSFVPYGSESDNYTVLGIINDFREEQNKFTKEKLWVLDITCNDISFPICINQMDLVGEPEVGRRFRGNVWVQGKIDFMG